MSRRFRVLGSALVVLVLLPMTALAADPSDIYTDYVTHGKLKCGYSRGDLNALLKDATLAEYTDPLTLQGLRVAVRGQLAGSCKTAPASGGTPVTPPPPVSTTTKTTKTSGGSTKTGTTGSANVTTDTVSTLPTVPGEPVTVAQGPIATTSGGGGGTPLGLIGLGAVAAIGLLGFGGWKLRRAAQGS